MPEKPLRAIVTRRARSGSNHFRVFAESTARLLGSPWAFMGAVGLVIAWAVVGPGMHYSNTWQIMINTGTTIATFLMIFLLQNTQIRDSKALHLKLDELLRAVNEARTGLVGLEKLPDERLSELEAELHDLAESERGPDQECPPATGPPVS